MESGVDQIKKLTKRQLLFCQEYCVDFNGTQAAIRAGLSEKSAKVQASRLLTKDNIRTEVKRITTERLTQIGVNPLRILTEYTRIAFGDLRKLYDENGRLKAPHELTDEEAAMLSSIEVYEEFGYDKEGEKTHIGDTKKVKLWDKPKALEALARHLSLFADKIDITSNGESVAIQVFKLPDNSRSINKTETNGSDRAADEVH